jgi:hypothetical protein
MNDETIQPVEQKRVASLTDPNYSKMEGDVSTPMAARMAASIKARMSDLNTAATKLREKDTPGNVYGL